MSDPSLQMGGMQRGTLSVNAAAQQKYFGETLAKIVKPANAAGDSIRKSFKQTNDMTDAMNKSFTGMKGKSSAIQAAISMGMDAMAVGVSKVQKQLVGAAKKLVTEGDIPGFIQGLIDIRTQFLDMESLSKPMETALIPINSMFKIFVGSAVNAVVSSDAFKELLKKLSDPVTIAKITDLGTRFGVIISEFIDGGALDRLFKLFEFIITTADNIRKLRDWRWPGSKIRPEDIPKIEPPLIGDSGISPSAITVEVAGVMTDSQMQRMLASLRRNAALWRV